MHINELRKLQKAEPFRILTLHLTNGRSFVVPHPEFMAIAPNGRMVIVFDTAGLPDHIDSAHIADIQVQPQREQGES